MYMHKGDSLTLKDQLKEYEISIIRNALQKYNKENDYINKVAKSLGISRASVYNKIREYNIKI